MSLASASGSELACVPIAKIVSFRLYLPANFAITRARKLLPPADSAIPRPEGLKDNSGMTTTMTFDARRDESWPHLAVQLAPALAALLTLFGWISFLK